MIKEAAIKRANFPAMPTQINLDSKKSAVYTLKPIDDEEEQPQLDLEAMLEEPYNMRRTSRRKKIDYQEQVELTFEEKRANRLLEREQRLAERQIEKSAEKAKKRKAPPKPKRKKKRGSSEEDDMTEEEETEEEEEIDYGEESGGEIAVEDSWVFKCSCGVSGTNIEGLLRLILDGSPSIPCTKCNVWQHISCAATEREMSDSDLTEKGLVCFKCKPKRQIIVKEYDLVIADTDMLDVADANDSTDDAVDISEESHIKPDVV